MADADAAKATKQYLPASISASNHAYDVKMYGSTIETWHHVAEKIGLQGWPTHESSGLPEADDYKVLADRLMATVAATGGSPTGQEPTEQPLLKTAKEPQPDEPDELQPAQPVWPDAYLDRAKELVTVEVNRSREENIPEPSTNLTETGQRKHTAQKLQSARIWTRSRTHRYSRGQSPMAAKSQRKAGSMRSVSKRASRCREISWKWKFTQTADQQRHSNSGRGHTTKQMRWNTS